MNHLRIWFHIGWYKNVSNFFFSNICQWIYLHPPSLVSLCFICNFSRIHLPWGVAMRTITYDLVIKNLDQFRTDSLVRWNHSPLSSYIALERLPEVRMTSSPNSWLDFICPSYTTLKKYFCVEKGYKIKDSIAME